MNRSINETLMANLKEATRLTQAGQLQEATAIIQRALHGTSNLNKVVKPVSAERMAGQGTPDRAKPVGDLLRGKLSGLNGLSTGLASSVEALPEGATFNSDTFTNQTGSRDYKLYIPSGYHGQSLPLVVMLHGCTQNPDDFAAGTGMNTLAESQLCLVLYPAQTASVNPSKCWNWFKPSDQQRESGEPAILAGMTRQIVDEYKLDEQRVYVAGLSAGGAMATTLAMTHPDLYAAVGVHSGLPHGAAHSIPSALAAMRGDAAPLASRNNKRAGAGATSSMDQKIPAIIFHGDRDTTVHPGNGDRVAAQHSGSIGSGSGPKNAIDIKSEQGKVPNGHAYTRTTHHDANGKAIVEQWSIHGAGHAWAGGAPQGSYTDPKGPDATGEMLRFFLTHSKVEQR
ncbi:alpha/beta hydrolase family esterase [Marinobacter sp. LV10MA510-1]|uniref:extracellular catalytic domain type 1 short-chain-length polyhydroxyalkanoate depolymerase n=1 Tax=Marinobacter sp. LV10MA510-1 TaxID=1415567 RepID=UPI000C00D4AB|nr:PHB depolymerase family esterase [Marinobacter sp. LV10MA510-1]PFG10819.1 poly(hydroxyalkanoate) depolymerase family esterase [Marinobacter sp. LV10MA510-1]